jgi:hypothetical protein
MRSFAASIRLVDVNEMKSFRIYLAIYRTPGTTRAGSYETIDMAASADEYYGREQVKRRRT